MPLPLILGNNTTSDSNRKGKIVVTRVLSSQVIATIAPISTAKPAITVQERRDVIPPTRVKKSESTPLIFVTAGHLSQRPLRKIIGLKSEKSNQAPSAFAVVTSAFQLSKSSAFSAVPKEEAQLDKEIEVLVNRPSL